MKQETVDAAQVARAYTNGFRYAMGLVLATIQAEKENGPELTGAAWRIEQDVLRIMRKGM